MATPKEKADQITAKHKPCIRRLLNEALRIPQLPRNLEYKAARMVEIVDELAAMIAPVAPCKKGCCHCCYQSVVISSWEAQRIAKATGRKLVDIPIYDPSENRQEEYIKRYSGAVCPFLKDQACSIYAVRPLACRAYFSLDDNIAICDIRITNPVPRFNLKQLEFSQAVMFMQAGCNFGDIREFFPS